MSRVKALAPRDTMLMLARLAPTLMMAKVWSGGIPRLTSNRFWTVKASMSTTSGLSFALCGDEQEVHLASLGTAPQDLVVDVHVLDVERDMLLRLPLDLLVELRGG